MSDRVSVLGSGIMGHGISLVAGWAGYEVCMRDINEEVLQNGMERIEESLGKFVRSDKLSESEKEDVLDRIQTTTDLEEAATFGSVIIEAIPEEMDLKKETFSQLDEMAPEETIFASNTSQLSITEMATATDRPDRFIGMHFFNPPQLMKLIEIIRGLQTSEETYETIVELSEDFGKETVTCDDSQGFITTRLITVLMQEAISLVEEGVAEPEDIDKACEMGFNHAMGPLKTADYSGLDTLLHSSESLREVFGEKFRPPQLLRQKVNANHHGVKTGQGFYNHEE